MSGEFGGQGINRNSDDSGNVAWRITLLAMSITSREHSCHGCTWSGTMFRYLTAVRDCAIGILGPKMFQENIFNSITLPLLLTCVHPKVHPDAVASVGNRCIQKTTSGFSLTQKIKLSKAGTVRS